MARVRTGVAISTLALLFPVNLKKKKKKAQDFVLSNFLGQTVLFVL